jgi:hypothetical protein
MKAEGGGGGWEAGNVRLKGWRVHVEAARAAVAANRAMATLFRRPRGGEEQKGREESSICRSRGIVLSLSLSLSALEYKRYE